MNHDALVEVHERICSGLDCLKQLHDLVHDLDQLAPGRSPHQVATRLRQLEARISAAAEGSNDVLIPALLAEVRAVREVFDQREAARAH